MRWVWFHNDYHEMACAIERALRRSHVHLVI